MTHSAAAGPRPSRRAIVRGAAWSVPVVSLAVAAPAFAASGATSTLSSGGQAVKWSDSKTKHVSWDLVLTNGPVPIDTITITFSYAPNSTGPFTSFEIYGYAPSAPRDTSWTSPPITVATSTITATHLADIAAGSTTNIHTDFAGGDNAAGTVKATATITYVGVPGSFSQTVGPLSWGSGNQHVHP